MATRTKLHWENCSQLYIISQLVWFQQSNWVIGGGRTIKPYKLLIKLFSWACFLKKSSSCRLPLFFIMFLQTSKKEKKKWMNAHLWRQIVKWKCIISTSLTTNITSKVKLSEYTLPLVSKWSGRPQTKKTYHMEEWQHKWTLMLGFKPRCLEVTPCDIYRYSFFLLHELVSLHIPSGL